MRNPALRSYSIVGRFAAACMLVILLLLSSCAKDQRITESMVRSQLQSLLQLHSYEYLYREILYFGEQETFLGIIPTRDRRSLFRMDFRVSAGLDLSRSYRVNLGQDGLLEVHLPDPEILQVDAIEGSIKQYLNRSFGGQVSLLDLSDLFELASDSLAADAVERGILEQARREAESLMRTLFSSMGVQDLRVTWGGTGG